MGGHGGSQGLADLLPWIDAKVTVEGLAKGVVAQYGRRPRAELDVGPHRGRDGRLVQRLADDQGFRQFAAEFGIDLGGGRQQAMHSVRQAALRRFPGAVEPVLVQVRDGGFVQQHLGPGGGLEFEDRIEVLVSDRRVEIADVRPDRIGRERDPFARGVDLRLADLAAQLEEALPQACPGLRFGAVRPEQAGEARSGLTPVGLQRQISQQGA